MVQTLEAIKGGGGSIRVGTTGTISSLMTRELNSTKAASQKKASSRNKHQSVSVSVPCGATTPKRLQARKSFDEPSSSGSCKFINHSSPNLSRKTKGYCKNKHQTPMIGSDDNALDRTFSREKNEKKGSNIVEVVGVKCGSSDNRPWTNPLTNRLKKLGFSKLSESII